MSELQQSFESYVTELETLGWIPDLPGGASEDEIDQLEERFGAPLTTELRDFYRLFRGGDNPTFLTKQFVKIELLGKGVTNLGPYKDFFGYEPSPRLRGDQALFFAGEAQYGWAYVLEGQHRGEVWVWDCAAPWEYPDDAYPFRASLADVFDLYTDAAKAGLLVHREQHNDIVPRVGQDGRLAEQWRGFLDERGIPFSQFL